MMLFKKIKSVLQIFQSKNIFARLCIYFLSFCLCFLILLWLALAFSPYPYKNTSLLSDTSFSRQVLDRNDNLLRLSLSADEKYRLYGTLEEVHADMQKAVLIYEDKYFYKHFGVNPIALVRAFYTSYIAQERMVGASTISMQTARLLFDLKTNTISGKITQIWYALLIEYHHTKNEILEAYFNLAPYGGNIEGIFAASRIYFHKEAHELSLSESLALVVVPQNPVARNPIGKDFEKVRNLFAKAWQEHFPNYNADNQPLEIYSLKDIPFLAPHFTHKVLSQSTKGRLETSLDLYAQKEVENTISSYVQRYSLYGIHNASALLVHAPTMEVRAYVGSANYFNTKIEGQVDAITSRRSPGSTLKPFIYALAMEQGLIHEGSILLDIPSSFRGYNPENYNAEYSGPLSAQKALILSRNIPAVNLASKLNNPSLYEFLMKAKVELLEDEKYYGLSLVLGGAELNPLELAKLYAILLNQGLYEELVFILNEKNESLPFSLLSKEVSAITLTMLESDLYYLQTRGGNIPLRLKTGTSNGFRDAWAVGAVGEYILVTWIGNFDNSSNHHFTGRELAVPLFTEISHTLTRVITFTDILPKQIEELAIQKIEVCADTGDTDINLCKDKATSTIHFIPGKSPMRDTGILRKILVDTRTNERVCRVTLENQAYIKEEVAEFWSSEAQNYFQQAGIYKNSPPPFDLASLSDPLCSQTADSAGQNPTILSPKEGIIYYINKQQAEISLKSQTNYDSAWTYWFINKAYVGKTMGDDVLNYAPKNELLEITAVDTFGRSTTKTYTMKFH